MKEVINSIATEMTRIITLQQLGKASKKELVDLAILTKALGHLNNNDNL